MIEVYKKRSLCWAICEGMEQYANKPANDHRKQQDFILTMVLTWLVANGYSRNQDTPKERQADSQAELPFERSA